MDSMSPKNTSHQDGLCEIPINLFHSNCVPLNSIDINFSERKQLQHEREHNDGFNDEHHHDPSQTSEASLSAARNETSQSGVCEHESTNYTTEHCLIGSAPCMQTE